MPQYPVTDSTDGIELCDSPPTYAGVVSAVAVEAKPVEKPNGLDYVITAQFKDRSARFMLDTGSAGTFLSKTFYNKYPGIRSTVLENPKLYKQASSGHFKTERAVQGHVSLDNAKYGPVKFELAKLNGP